MAEPPTKQKLIVKIVGVSVGVGTHVQEFEREIELDRDADKGFYRAQHAGIENQVIDALNAVQLKLAADRGDGGF